MTASTLTEFLLARIVEDEAAANAASPGGWQYGDVESVAGGTLYDETRCIANLVYEQPRDHDGTIVRHLLEVEADANGEHIARHDPARVLAECEAKRRIVEVVAGWQHTTFEDCWYSCAATYDTDVENACCDDGREGMGCDCGLEYRARSILSPLAAVYADHPDFREEWRP